ncbi:MAG: motility associated factor glycosyltransferase family protein [Lachnospiraceae bacterium]
MEIKKILAKDGTEIIEVLKENKRYRLNSLYHPYNEAEKFALQFAELESGSVLCVFGYGNGIFPKKLREICKKDVTLVFYEPCNEIYKICDVIEENIFLFVPEEGSPKTQIKNIREFPLLLEELTGFSNHEKITCCALPQYAQLFSDEYEDFLSVIQYRKKKIKSIIDTARVFGQDGVRNNIYNLKYLANSYCGDSFINCFPKDMPAIIVSAGPSLEKNIEQLKYAKNKAIILCVDSAVKFLLNNDIVPDFLVCVDPKKPLNRFDNRMKDIPMVCSPDMNYKVLDLLEGCKVIFASGDNDYISEFYSKADHKLERLRSGGSVATFTFSLCRYWGFRTIILVGQDLALTNKQMYAGGNQLLNHEKKEELIPVEDINGDIIYSPRDYYLYLQWFEQEIRIHNELTVIDSTEGGAKISGTKILPLSESLKMYANREYKIDEMITNIQPAFDEIQKRSIKTSLITSLTTLEELMSNLKKGIGIIDKELECSVLKDSINTAADLQIAQICDDYNRMKEGFYIQRQIDATSLEEYMNNFQGLETCNKKERYLKLKKYFELLLQATDNVVTIWKEL